MNWFLRRAVDPFLKYWVFPGLACLLPACTTLGPEYEEPEVAWLDDFQSDLYGQLGNSDGRSRVDLQFWWQLFDDAELNGLLELARRENPSLRIAGLRILESRAAQGIVSSALYPQVQVVDGDISYINNQIFGGADESLASYQAGVSVGWELDFWGRFKLGIESADAAFFASIFNQRDAQVLLNAQVADLYFSYRTILLRIHIARKNAAIQKRSFEITEKLYKSGQSSELDLQQAKAQYMATLSTIPGLELANVQLRNALCVLLGRPPGNLPELLDVVKELPELDPVVIQEIPAQLLLRRPDIRSAAWQVAAQSAQIGIARADFYPSISLFGSLNFSGNTLSGRPESLGLGLGPSLRWNIFDYGRIENNVRVQDARLQQMIENYQNSVLQAAREIDDAAISVIKTREQEIPLSASLRAAERSLELANVRYHDGIADFQRVIDAQRAVAAQSERKLINDSNHISAVINFYKSLGGGWIDTPVEELLPEVVRDTMEERSDWGDLLSEPFARAEDELSNREVSENE